VRSAGKKCKKKSEMSSEYSLFFLASKRRP